MTKDTIRRLAEALFSAIKVSFAPVAHSHPLASPSSDGLMSMGDKTKLDSIRFIDNITDSYIDSQRLQQLVDGDTFHPELSGMVSDAGIGTRFSMAMAMNPVKIARFNARDASGRDAMVSLFKDPDTGRRWVMEYVEADAPRTQLVELFSGYDYYNHPAFEYTVSLKQSQGEYAPVSHTHKVATVSSDGFMSAADKAKLDKAPIGEKLLSDFVVEDNNFDFSDDKIGSIYDFSSCFFMDMSFPSTMMLVGRNIDYAVFANVKDISDKYTLVDWNSGGMAYFLTFDAGSHSVDNLLSDSAISARLSQKDISELVLVTATATAPGFMSAEDKAKLDGLDSAGGGIDATAVATPTAAGLMSALDKQKLDALEQVSLAPKPSGHRLTLTAEVSPTTREQTGRIIISGHEELMAAGQEVYLFRMGTFENRYRRSDRSEHCQVGGWRCYNGTSHKIESDGSLLVSLPDSKNIKGATTTDVRCIVNVSDNVKVGRVAGWGNTHAAVNKPGRMIIDGTETKIQHANRYLAFRAAIAMGPVNPDPAISAMTPEKMTTTLAEFLIIVSPNDNTWQLKIL